MKVWTSTQTPVQGANRNGRSPSGQLGREESRTGTNLRRRDTQLGQRRRVLGSGCLSPRSVRWGSRRRLVRWNRRPYSCCSATHCCGRCPEAVGLRWTRNSAFGLCGVPDCRRLGTDDRGMLRLIGIGCARDWDSVSRSGGGEGGCRRRRWSEPAVTMAGRQYLRALHTCHPERKSQRPPAYLKQTTSIAVHGL